MIGAHSYLGGLFIRHSFDRFELLHKRIIQATIIFEIRSDPVGTFLLVHVPKSLCPFQSHI
jgi:hypothetical protein